MVSSKEVINYLKNNLNSKYYLSFFIAGSVPNELLPQTDLDIFIVINGKYRNGFFDNLTNIMDKFISKNKSVAYSLFKGPLKYKTKGLIHFIIYTEEGNDEYGNREQFKHELRETLKNFLRTAKIIHGKSINELIKNIDFFKKDERLDNKKVISEKYETLKEKGYIQYKEWKKTKKDWQLVKVKKYPNKFFKEYLTHYFEKNLKSYH